LAARPPEPTDVTASHSQARIGTKILVAADEPASTIVIGGTLNRWKNDTAGNVVELNGAEVPGAPTAATVESGNGTATVSWQAPDSDGGATIVSYSAKASPGIRGCTTAGETSCVITGLSPATSYTVTVTATNSAGTGPASAPSSAFWPDVSIPMATSPAVTPRTGVVLSGTSIPLRVSWSGADTGGSGVIGYELGRSTNGGTTWTVVSGSVVTTAFDLTAPSTGTVRFRVRAVDRAGNTGAWATGLNQSPRLVQQSSTTVKYGGTWASTSAAAYSGGSARYATRAGAYATFTSTGRSIALVSTRATTRGQVKVYVNGVYQATVSMYGSTAYRQVAWQKTWSTAAKRTIKLVVVGTRGRPRFDLDGFVSLS
jgi:hypothetical protein